MFPAAPSPNSQALYNSLASGGATPSTLDFHRTAMNAAAAKRNDAQLQSITSQPQDMLNGMDGKALQNQPANEVFGQHDANDAANGLFMLASQSRTNSQGGQYAMAQQQTVHAHPQPSNSMMGVQSTDTSPILADRNHSGSLSTASGRGVSEISEESEQKNRPNTRGRGKKAATAQTNGRRKTEDTPSKGPASKKSKGNSGSANLMMEPEPPSEEEPDLSKDEYNANGKKMTDEEKRKNFLERNR
jgi:ATF/CREB family transcription factor